jgi:hypothetical protein
MLQQLFYFVAKNGRLDVTINQKIVANMQHGLLDMSIERKRVLLAINVASSINLFGSLKIINRER